MRMASSGRINRYVETFYRGDGRRMHFVKPIEFWSESKGKLVADFTYNKGDSVIKNVSVNMDIYSGETPVKADSIKIMFGDSGYCDTSIKLLFAEMSGRKPYSRQNMDFPESCFEKMLTSEQLVFITYTGGKEKKYFSGKQWSKSREKIHLEIYEAYRSVYKQ